MSDTIVTIQSQIQTLTVSEPQRQTVALLQPQLHTLITSGQTIPVLVTAQPQIQTLSNTHTHVTVANNTQVHLITAGAQGPAGQGVPLGGSTGQYLKKNTATDFDTSWGSLDSTLAALASYNTNGIICQTAADTFAGRTIAAGTNISISNGNGVAGNPVVALSGQVAIANGGHAGSTASAGCTNLIAPLATNDASCVAKTAHYVFYYDADGNSYQVQGNVLASSIAGISSQVKGTGANKTTNYTAGSGDGTIFCNATGGAFTITLPTAVGLAGRGFNIVKTDSSANAVTIGTTSSQTINGVTTQTLVAQYQAKQPTSDGVNWFLT